MLATLRDEADRRVGAARMDAPFAGVDMGAGDATILRTRRGPVALTPLTPEQAFAVWEDIRQRSNGFCSRPETVAEDEMLVMAAVEALSDAGDLTTEHLAVLATWDMETVVPFLGRGVEHRPFELWFDAFRKISRFTKTGSCS